MDADQFIQAFNEELSLDEKAVFAKKEDEAKKTSKIEDDLEEKSKVEKVDNTRSNIDLSKVDEFKLPEDENK